jgi:hypothetical protein
MNVTEKLAQLVLAAQRENKRTIPLDDLVTMLVEAHLPDQKPRTAFDAMIGAQKIPTVASVARELEKEFGE